MKDIELTCANPKCPEPQFVWSVGEQRFMEKLLQSGKIDEIIAPRRCPDCRKARKEYLESKKNNQN